METEKKTNRFMAAEKIELPKNNINIQDIEAMANDIQPKESLSITSTSKVIDVQKLKGLTIKLTETEYKKMYTRKMQISTDLTVQEYVANLIRNDIK